MQPHERIVAGRYNRLTDTYARFWEPEQQTLHFGIFESPDTNLADAMRNHTHRLLTGLNRLRPITTESRVLDIGCGTGAAILDACRTFSCKGVGIDVSPVQLKRAHKALRRANHGRQHRLGASFVLCDAHDLLTRFGPGAFSHVLSQDTMFHMSRMRDVYRQIFRCLRIGGSASVMDLVSLRPARECLSREERELIYGFWDWRRPYTPTRYRTMLERTGFKIDRIDNTTEHMGRSYQLLAKKLEEVVVDKPSAMPVKVVDRLRRRYAAMIRATDIRAVGLLYIQAIKT